MLVTIEQSRSHLRLDDDYPADQVGLYLSAATEAAQQFLNRRVYATVEDMAAAVLDGTAGADPMVANDLIRAAILLILGNLFAHREDTVVGATVATLPMGAHALLQPFRIGMGV